MRNLLGMFALLSFGLPVLAQAPATAASNVVVLQASVQGCPVGFEARRTPGGGLISVSPSAHSRAGSYQLTFSPGYDHAITQARITLHGLAGGRVISARSSTPLDDTENFDLSPSASGAKHQFHSTIYTRKLTGVQWIELNELTYADGSSWHESDAATCRVSPNGYMLVAGTR